MGFFLVKVPGPIDFRRFDIRIARIHLIFKMSEFCDGSVNYMQKMHYYKGIEENFDMDAKLVVS